MTNYFLLACCLTVLTACSLTTPTLTPQTGAEAEKSVPERSGNTRQRMEEAIARRILNDIHLELPTLSPVEQSAYLNTKKSLFEVGVDLEMTSNWIRFEKKLLDFLYLQTDLAAYGTGYLPVLQQKTSLDWTLQDYSQLIEKELSRIDQTLAVLAEDAPADFDLKEYVQSRRHQAFYQEDNTEGRQRYLDTLADAMLEAQLNWYDSLENYSESELAIFGEEDMEQMFRYSSAGLTINLSSVRDLPAFELKALAVYYGFPGLRSISEPEAESLKQFLRLPAYNHGWAAYMVEAIGHRDTAYTIDYLLFSRMLAALAQADLNINTGIWDHENALSTLHEGVPLSRHRLSLMLDQTLIEPGQFVATLAGKTIFSKLHEQCLAEGRGDVCHSVFNQRIVDWGPLPFDLLEEKLFQ